MARFFFGFFSAVSVTRTSLWAPFRGASHPIKHWPIWARTQASASSSVAASTPYRHPPLPRRTRHPEAGLSALAARSPELCNAPHPGVGRGAGPPAIDGAVARRASRPHVQGPPLDALGGLGTGKWGRGGGRLCSLAGLMGIPRDHQAAGPATRAVFPRGSKYKFSKGITSAVCSGFPSLAANYHRQYFSILSLVATASQGSFQM